MCPYLFINIYIGDSKISENISVLLLFIYNLHMCTQIYKFSPLNKCMNITYTKSRFYIYIIYMYYIYYIHTGASSHHIFEYESLNICIKH